MKTFKSQNKFYLSNLTTRVSSKWNIINVNTIIVMIILFLWYFAGIRLVFSQLHWGSDH